MSVFMIWLDCIEHELVGHSGKFPPKNQWAIKPEPQEMFGGFIHRSSQGIWMSRDDLVYLSLNFVMDQLRRNQPRRRKISEKNWPGASTIDSSIFLLVPFCGVTLERRKPPQVILDVLGEARGEQYSINLHYPLHCYSVLAGQSLLVA